MSAASFSPTEDGGQLGMFCIFLQMSTNAWVELLAALTDASTLQGHFCAIATLGSIWELIIRLAKVKRVMYSVLNCVKEHAQHLTLHHEHDTSCQYF